MVALKMVAEFATRHRFSTLVNYSMHWVVEIVELEVQDWI